MNMEVESSNLVTTFLYKQEVLNFHVSSRQSNTLTYHGLHLSVWSLVAKKVPFFASAISLSLHGAAF